ncbi:Hypothetical protein Ccan_04920 [Capnocytophaga canimorsus Cc5]|uniref:Uncharacterized protein n=1 Tax=Capnocytophaga canimorsus (strain 5) TaxID=860228 RepID=F9YS61_CAPCC|nr:Hypothetical protein Ccan_04920 [Capnocytophaga canimorsus Cc5]
MIFSAFYNIEVFLVKEYIYFCKTYTQIYYLVANGFRSYESWFILIY